MTDTISLEYIRKFVYDRAAIVIGADKDYLVESRLLPVARKHGVEGVDGVVQELKKFAAREIKDDVVEALTTNETYFFRDQHPFDVLKEVVLPEILEKRSGQRKLNLWCGASSTGQEPYSILMTLFEAVPDLAQWDVKFVATDINQTVLDKAASGVYKQHEVNRGLPASLLVKYFDRVGTDWVVQQRLRDKVEFKILNLAEAWPFRGSFDIIFMRNVLIYFDVEMKKHILQRARKLLTSDGVLFLGGAETTVNLDDNYKNVRSGRSVFYRKAA